MGTIRAMQVVMAAVLVAVLALVGCGHRAAPAPKAQINLPEWAPKNPSPEFLRAWKVLKPVPTESPSAEASAPEEAAEMARFRSTWPAAYEFFGTMSDEQIERFLSTKELRVPVKSLTATQRAALDHWFEVYRTAMKGAARGPMPDDYLVKLYKEGAAKDLSNVDAGFATIPITISKTGATTTHRVSIWLWVRFPKGGNTQFGYPFAQL